MAMITGPIYWSKILGEPQPGYQGKGREWSFDLGVDQKTEKKLAELEVSDYIKTKDGHASGGKFIKFKRNAVKADGSAAKPFKVVGPDGKDWPDDKRIGNGSIVNVKLAINEKQDGKMKPSAVAIQVWEYVPYEGGEEFPTRQQDGEENWD